MGAPPDPDRRRDRVRFYLEYSQLGLQFFLTVFLCFLLGNWADGALGSAPLLAFGGLSLGLVAGVILLYRRLFSGGGRRR